MGGICFLIFIIRPEKQPERSSPVPETMDLVMNDRRDMSPKCIIHFKINRLSKLIPV
jgi:hypothetical protein